MAESPYGHQAVGSIMPMRDIFTSLFFVSIGMLFDVQFLLRSPGTVALILGAVLVLKTLTGGAAAKAVGLPLKSAALVALGLSQVGEFSFILAKIGMEHSLLTQELYQLFMVVSVVTMALTPSLLSLGQAVCKRHKSYTEARPAEQTATGHIIVVGYGINGRNVVRAATLAGIPHVVIEMNPSVVRREQKDGENIFFGDASSPDVLAHAGVHSAQVMVIAIADPAATRHITAHGQGHEPGSACHRLARALSKKSTPSTPWGPTRWCPRNTRPPWSFSTRVLRRLMIPESEIRRRVHELKAQSYKQLRLQEPEPLESGGLADLLADVQMSTFKVKTGRCAGRTYPGPGQPAPGPQPDRAGHPTRRPGHPRARRRRRYHGRRPAGPSGRPRRHEPSPGPFRRGRSPVIGWRAASLRCCHGPVPFGTMDVLRSFRDLISHDTPEPTKGDTRCLRNCSG